MARHVIVGEAAARRKLVGHAKRVDHGHAVNAIPHRPQ